MTNQSSMRKLEIAILSAKRENNIGKLDDVKRILEHKKRVLDMSLEKEMTGYAFERRPKFKTISEEYSGILRLFRLTESYNTNGRG